MNTSCERSIRLISITIGITISLILSTNKEERRIEVMPNIEEKLSFEDSVYQYIVSLNISHPEIVFKQAIIESGNFKSNIYIKCNNMFGMTYPKKRPTLAIGKYKVIDKGKAYYFCIYNNWKESIIDYALYQSYTAKGLTKEEYIEHLGSYAEDINYKSKVK